MSEQALHSPSVVAFPNKEDELDKAGQAACDLVHQAATAAEQKMQHVLAVAHKTSLQLRAAEDRVASLEAEVKHYQGSGGSGRKMASPDCAGDPKYFLVYEQKWGQPNT